ncbi:periodic tryptophan protein 1-like protein [Cucumis melo var. makuwa]|uniref:Periodic tryptophan protein 1-like protein n=2 Tax=Cucumis melo TaxID=3656 RepID=A0A5A7U9N1_CUCMM|nr:periodic tryptophan protein 1-like protein [Cucumis melo var. makuwa]TYK00669.1 periodic tryptophan protein 1-like protein [Cucumis melo var. makuwa]
MSPFICSIANHHNRFIAAAVEEIVPCVSSSQEIIDELLKSSQVVEDSNKHSDDEADEEDMDVEDASDEQIANALAVAQALRKSSETTNLKTKYDTLLKAQSQICETCFKEMNSIDDINLSSRGHGKVHIVA